MSDKEFIIRSLEKVDRRIRTNRLLRELPFGLSVLLVIPVLFKVLDLFRPFRGLTVAGVLTVWLMATAAYVVWRISKKTTLSHAAAALDHKGLMHDQIKSAYWFMTNPNAV